VGGSFSFFFFFLLKNNFIYLFIYFLNFYFHFSNLGTECFFLGGVGIFCQVGGQGFRV
jgi:hypothetical protein